MDNETLRFFPIQSIWLVTEFDCQNFSSNDTSKEIIGEKAFGLSCLPEKWTLPYIVVSSELYEQYYKNGMNETTLNDDWQKNILQAMNQVGISDSDKIIVRSSACNEGLAERGQYASIWGTHKDLFCNIISCLKKMASNVNTQNSKIFLVIQKYANTIISKGHLSNERRLSKETRDWIIEFDNSSDALPLCDDIHLRNWREKKVISSETNELLQCIDVEDIKDVLKIVSAWSYQKKLRIHYEWVWDGEYIYIVQADEANLNTGINPNEIAKNFLKSDIAFNPKCLKVIDAKIASKYKKIKNVFTYLSLGLPITNLYILDDPAQIENLACGIISQDLKDDLSHLIENSLIIRMDIETEDLAKRQLLPRTQEINLDDTFKWLIDHSLKAKNELKENFVYIFHNFIPAVASAFAYAVPKKKIVQIESLWGLPEGLYYYSHDKYVVDTNSVNLAELNKEKFIINKQNHFKHNFVFPEIDGTWSVRTLCQPYDWNDSIQKDEWINEIALQSRRIAETENKSLSIMWFVGVDQQICKQRVFPWYHEEYEYINDIHTITYKPKTPFEKTFYVKSLGDIDLLEKEANNSATFVRRIHLIPQETDILRNKDAIHRIGELAKNIDAVVLLEGGVLSHAYYQLVKTGANIEVATTFKDNSLTRFNKLVRDEIPRKIERNGEVATVGSTTGNKLLKLLKNKLVEEAFEVSDADPDTIIEELADVNEVIRGILNCLNLDEEQLKQKQNEKREKVGGFDKGVVLIRTNNPLHTKTEPDKEYSNDDIVTTSENIKKWSDHKKFSNADESITNISIPLSLNNWSTDLSENGLKLKDNIKIVLHGKRTRANMQIEISVFENNQLSLFD